ncbi:hypothetical protein EV191_107137 [Tamaricihabitans halophyticus]|uniref:PknH-like protein n=1 Tax=Tamaricihabitans halophyticus TaxID=1262583 RepID=A0A4R2QMS2_9PSEU|nr:hypothetical protein [Tamaricihabitans halophyticus]TCP50873.1 hypothetical protein EV191_107137 [Tamaricihabitans halophyticus]
MRLVSVERVAASLAVVGMITLTACADQPRELRSAVDGGESGAATSTTRLAPEPAPPSNAGDPERQPAAEVGSALFTAADVADEEVAPDPADTEPVAAIQDCVSPAQPALAEEGTYWRYPTGSRLQQVVTGYPAGEAVRLAEQARDCGTRPLDLAAVLAPAAAQGGGWCVAEPEPTCAALLADGQRLAAIAVYGTTEERAAEAVLRLAPVTAEALRRGEPG